MSTLLQTNLHGTLNLKNQLGLMQLRPSQRKRILRAMGKQVQRQARTNTRAQRETDGGKMKGRKDGKRRKVLRRIALAKHLRVLPSGTTGVDVTWTNSLMGKIARMQQEGIDERMTAQQAAKRRGQPDYNAPATRKQAVALREVGYKRSVNGRYRNASLRWIQDNMTLGQAGIVLRMMRNERSKQSWVIPGTARPFLGVDKQTINRFAKEAMDTINPTKTSRI